MWWHVERRCHRWNAARIRYEDFDLARFSQCVAVSFFFASFSSAYLDVITVSFELNLRTETVQHANPAEVVVVTPQTTLRVVLQRMKEANTGNILISEQERLVGIFTERDVLKLLTVDTELDQPIEQVMVRNPLTVSASDSVGKAISKMSHGGYRRVPVVDEKGRALSILKVSGILRYLVEHFPDVVYTLPPEPHYRPKSREGA